MLILKFFKKVEKQKQLTDKNEHDSILSGVKRDDQTNWDVMVD